MSVTETTTRLTRHYLMHKTKDDLVDMVMHYAAVNDRLMQFDEFQKADPRGNYDWEDGNKAAFVNMVSLWLRQMQIHPRRAACILFNAYRVRRKHVPIHLVGAVDDFMAWQLEGATPPEWASKDLQVMGGVP